MKICLLGVGRMGGWLMDMLESEHDISWYDPGRHSGSGIQTTGRLRSLEDIRERNPEMLINAVSLQHTIEAFRSVEAVLPSSCMLCDIASIKGDLHSYYKSVQRPFVSIHPMFGPTFARMKDLRGENAVILSESDPDGKAFWKGLLEKLGVQSFEYAFSEHDPMMAYSLTLPFVSSLVFSSCVTTKTVPGTTFRRHLEVARGLLAEDDYLLTEILFNRESLSQLQKISGRLNHLWHIIDQRDGDEARKLIDVLRGNLLHSPDTRQENPR